ncbi:MAG: porin [Bacteroidota bacterium]
MRRLSWIFAVPVLCIAFLFCPPTTAHAQSKTIEISPDISFAIGGSFQTRVSYVRSDGPRGDIDATGFGVRRARLVYRVNIGDRWGLNFQNELTGVAPSLIDLFVTYRINDRLSLRTGRLPDAQPRAYLLSPYPLSDSFDRANIARRWGADTIGNDGRDFGLSAHYETETSRILLFLHNGDGAWTSSKTSSVISGPGTDDRPGVAVSVYGEHRPANLTNVEVGAFVGYNAEKPDRTRGRNYTSYAAHVYYGRVPGSQPLRLKLDVIGVLYEEESAAAPDQHTLGANFLAAALVTPNLEAFAQLERRYFDVQNASESEAFVTIGLNASLAPTLPGAFNNQRITLAYEYMTTDLAMGDERQSVVLQLQLVF